MQRQERWARSGHYNDPVLLWPKTQRHSIVWRIRQAPMCQQNTLQKIQVQAMKFVQNSNSSQSYFVSKNALVTWKLDMMQPENLLGHAYQVLDLLHYQMQSIGDICEFGWFIEARKTLEDAKHCLKRCMLLQPRHTQHGWNMPRWKKNMATLTNVEKFWSEVWKMWPESSTIKQSHTSWGTSNNIRSARRLMSGLIESPIEQSWKTMLEGAQMEGRDGMTERARKYLNSWWKTCHGTSNLSRICQVWREKRSLDRH